MMGYGRGYGYGIDSMMGGGWWVGLLMFLFGSLIIAGIVLLVIWAVRASSGHAAGSGSVQPHGATGHDEAVSIARKRLASGEIDKQQYDDIMRALSG